MMNRIRKWAAGAAIVAALIIVSFVAGCGGDDGGKTTRTAAKKTGPTIDRRPPISSAPKAVPVETTTVAKAEEPKEPELPKTVSYEEAEAAYNEGKYGLAVELFNIYTDGRDQNPWGFYMLGLSAWKAEEYEYAEQSFEKALALAPNHVKSLLNLGRVLLDTGRPGEALVRIENAIELDPGSGVAWRLKGRALSQSGDSDGAIEAYRRAITIDDRDAWAMNNLALILIDREEFEEALLPLARAIEIDDSRAVFWNNLGMALERTGHYRSAEEAYGTAFEADDGHDRAYANLVRIRNVSEEPGMETVDLTELAHRFMEKMEDWKFAEAGAETDEVTALTDSLTIGIAAVAQPDTSRAGPE